MPIVVSNKVSRLVQVIARVSSERVRVCTEQKRSLFETSALNGSIEYAVFEHTRGISRDSERANGVQ